MTVIVVAFLGYMMIRNKDTAGMISYDIANNKLVLKKSKRGGSNDDTEAEGKGKYSKKEYIEIQKQFHLCIIKSGITTIENLTEIIPKNNINSYTIKDWQHYVEHKIELIRGYFNNEFAKSTIPEIKNLTLQKLIEKDYMFIRSRIRESFNIIYNEHKDKDKDILFYTDLSIVLTFTQELLEYITISFTTILKEEDKE